MKSRARTVLIPGVGDGRDAKAFRERRMSATGIEFSETAVALARSQLGLAISIYHGSVTSMPCDVRLYDGAFCYGRSTFWPLTNVRSSSATAARS